MIELTVKTLDSQNHVFTVEDEITVAQFKEKISETVNIPADSQRIIYCGRVLQDTSKLSEYDVNGKVVHLVQRPPPTANSGQNRAASPPRQRRQFRGLEHAMYLGSMAIPSNLLDTPSIVPPLPTHSLAASRLNVAKRMLRRADAVLTALENPTSRTPEQPTQDEPQEEMTPVFEARVIVPGNSAGGSIDQALVLSAVQNSLLSGVSSGPLNGSQPTTVQDTVSATLVPPTINDLESPQLRSASSTPEGASPLASTENLAAENVATTENDSFSTIHSPTSDNSASGNAQENSDTSAESISRTTEYADLLDTMGRLQARFAPFLQHYHTFMREDPTISPENLRQTQAMINRVSEILHFLGHAYHSLSDIIVRVRTPAPRPLLCRPILIQHSAVVQAGIPFQVEAQINFSADRPSGQSGNTASSQTPNAASSNNQQPAGNDTTQASESTGSNTGPTITIPLLRGLPRSHNINVTVHRAGPPRNNNNNNTQASGTQSSATSGTPGVPASSASETSSSTASTSDVPPSTAPENASTTTTSTGTSFTSSANLPGATFNIPGFNNSNVEFFMELAPESIITIDSLDQAGDVLRGALNAPPPDLIQSIMQMAGQMMNRAGVPGMPGNVTVNTGTTLTPSAPPAEATTGDQPASCSEDGNQPANESAGSNSQGNLSNAGAARTTPFQNSQARGNTQTQPTTSTHTRSTSRPHVHLAQHAMQGFDPFLPCNSHHVTPRRRQLLAQNVLPQQQQNASNANASRSNNEATAEQRNASQQANPIYSILQGIINSVRVAYNQRGGAQASGNTASANTAPSSASNAAPAANAAPGANAAAGANAPPVWSSFLPPMQNMNLSGMGQSQGPTIAQLLQHLPDESYVEGESIFNDLLMLLSRHLTLGDIVMLNSGRLEPLMRKRRLIREFFLCRVLDGGPVDRGVTRLIDEMRPFLNMLVLLPTRDDIDIVRSTQTLFRCRLPNIISLAASQNPNSLRMLVDQTRTTARHLCGLLLRVSRNGQQGVEDVFDRILTRYMQGIPRDIQQWTLLTSTAHLRQFMSNLNVPESILQPYIVRRVEAVAPTVVNSSQSSIGNECSEHEAMEVEEQEASSSSSNELGTAPINFSDDAEGLPTVVLGSESWHNQVPADWVPIIARDTQRQRRQNSQSPFSDAYLSGMPNKRRKIVANNKPHGSVPHAITESVRHAVTATGLATVAPIEDVALTAGTDLNVRSAYWNSLRAGVQSNLRNNEDFTPDRFPHASNYFSNNQ